MDSITSQMQQIYQNFQSRISQLDSELKAMLSHNYYGPKFDKKEKEIQKLKTELEQIELERQRPTLFTTSPPLPTISPAIVTKMLFAFPMLITSGQFYPLVLRQPHLFFKNL